MTGPIELLSALSHVLSRLNVAWYLFGAQAVLIWVRPRLTADVDVTVRLKPEDTEPFVRVMSDESFRLRGGFAGDFVQQTRVLPFVHDPSGLGLDVVLAGPGLEEVFLARAVRVDLAGVQVPVSAPDCLLCRQPFQRFAHGQRPVPSSPACGLQTWLTPRMP